MQSHILTSKPKKNKKTDCEITCAIKLEFSKEEIQKRPEAS